MRSLVQFRRLATVAAVLLAGVGLAGAGEVHPPIAWLNDFEAAKAEALRLNKPLLFVIGAPRCGGVPGVW